MLGEIVSIQRGVSLSVRSPIPNGTFELEHKSRDSSDGCTDHVGACTCKTASNHGHEFLDAGISIFDPVLLHPIHHTSLDNATAAHFIAHCDDEVESTFSGLFRGLFRAENRFRNQRGYDVQGIQIQARDQSGQ